MRGQHRCWGQASPNPALQVRGKFLHKPVSRVGVQNFLRPSAGGGCSALPRSSLPEAASDGVEGRGGALNLLLPTCWNAYLRHALKHMEGQSPCVRLVGEQKIEKQYAHTSPIPTVGLLLPIYVISCAYFKIVRRAGGIENTITRPFRLAAAGAFYLSWLKKKVQWNLRGKLLSGKE